MLEAAFIFIAPGADPAVHRSTVATPGVNLTAIGVSTYEQGVAAAVEMADAGCTAIELCGGFGIRGTYMVQEAVKGQGPRRRSPLRHTSGAGQQERRRTLLSPPNVQGRDAVHHALSLSLTGGRLPGRG